MSRKKTIAPIAHMIHNLHDDENQNIFFYGGTYLHTHTNIAIQNQEC
jgi:hypothetical protein